MTERTQRRPIVLILVALIALAGAGIWQFSPRGRSAHESISQAIDSATRAEVTIAAGVGRVRIDAAEQPGTLIAGHIAYLREGDIYISPAYATAQNRVDLRASGGIGQITVMPASE